MAHEVHDFFLEFVHESLLLMGILCLGDENFDDTKPVAVNAKLHKVFLDLVQNETGLPIEATAKKLLNDMCALLID